MTFHNLKINMVLSVSISRYQVKGLKRTFFTTLYSQLLSLIHLS